MVQFETNRLTGRPGRFTFKLGRTHSDAAAVALCQKRSWRTVLSHGRIDGLFDYGGFTSCC
jgi:hypothetical protein